MAPQAPLRIAVCCLFALLAFVPGVQAEPAPEEGLQASGTWVTGAAARAALEARLATLTPFEGTFHQTLEDSFGQRLGDSAGEFALEPGAGLRWLTHRPYEEALVVNDAGAWLWDPALQQVLRRPKEDLLQTPAALLLGLDPDWLDGYVISRSTAQPTLDRYRLASRSQGLGPATLSLTWLEEELALLTVEEGSGQRLQLRFEALRPRPSAPDDFVFIVPEGAELLDEAAP
jgi:outer membrane lipoprotein-sorting protein